jgi:hypothetical protein
MQASHAPLPLPQPIKFGDVLQPRQQSGQEDT